MCSVTPAVERLFKVSKKAFEDTSDGIIINERCINKLPYADDMVILTDNAAAIIQA